MGVVESSWMRGAVRRYLSGVMRPKLRAVRAEMPDVEGKRVLDVGAGLGVGGFVAESLGASEVVMVEPEPRLRGFLESVGVRALGGRVESLPFETGAFDVVVALDVIEHVWPEWQGRALAELARVGDVALVGTDNPDGWFGPAVIQAGMKLGRLLGRSYGSAEQFRSGACTHERELGPSELMELGSEVGVEVEFLRSYPNRGPLGVGRLVEGWKGPAVWPFALYRVRSEGSREG